MTNPDKMSMSAQIGLGFRTYGNAISFIFNNGLWWFFIFPVLLNILLFWGGFELKEFARDYLQRVLLDWTDLGNAGFFLSGFLKGALEWFLRIAFGFFFFFIFAYFGGYIILIIMSPILAYLSEKTEKINTKKDYPFSAEQLMRDIVRGILIAVRNMIIETGYMIIFFIFGIIPVIGWLFSIASPFILFFISSYFYGFSYMDYTNERKRLNVGQSVRYIRKYKGFAITNGGIFSLSLLIPFCGVMISPFVAIISVVAATLGMNETDKDYKKN